MKHATFGHTRKHEHSCTRRSTLAKSKQRVVRSWGRDSSRRLMMAHDGPSIFVKWGQRHKGFKLRGLGLLNYRLLYYCGG